MKPSKSPDNTEVTPSKKKLKQARLPFKLITEVSPSPLTPITRKRKLSAADAETIPKIGKISKDEDLIENTVVISDDEIGDDTKNSNKEIKRPNPYVKLVDAARKKKLQKNKKKNGKISTGALNGSLDTVSKENLGEVQDEAEKMDVDLQTPESENCNNLEKSTDDEKVTKSSRKSTPKRKLKPSPKSRSSSRTASKITSDSTILLVEDSNDNVKEDKSPLVSDPSIQNNGMSPEDDSSHVEIKNDIKVEHDKVTGTHSKNEEVNTSQVDEISEESMQKTESIQELEKEGQEKDMGLVTPKRSSRIKVNSEEKDKSLNKSKLDESVCSNPSTPKQNRSLSVTTSLDDSLNDSTATANLTPKQLQKKLEAAKKREERDKEKLEREKKRQQEKEERAKQKQEKEDQRKKEREEKEEAKRKEKEEKEEQRRKEKEEKEKQKELEKKLKEEKEEQKKKEREEKEEQRKKEKEAREEEKRKKQEALEIEKQEQEIKKKKAAEAFVNFFVPKQKSDKGRANSEPVSKSCVLSSFAIKSDMRLAPIIRADLTDEKKEALDSFIVEQNLNKNGLYLQNLREGIIKPQSGGKTWPLFDKEEDDVMIVEDELPLDGAGEVLTCESAVREKLRPKLFSFHENRRPPYWGTWRKKSQNVTPRRPFGQDKKQLDYEVDSDEEWEEEPEGESVDGSAAGSDIEEDGDEYEVDNEVFVPHGYLSDEEATMDDDDVLSMSPETQKARLKHLEDEFESEMKKPTEKLKPRLYGILWETKDGGKPDNCVDALWNYFGKFAMIMNDPTPFLQPSNEPEEADKKKAKKKKVNEGEKQSPKADKKKKPNPESKESKPKNDLKKNTPEVKKNQPGINSFLTKIKSTV